MYQNRYQNVAPVKAVLLNTAKNLRCLDNFSRKWLRQLFYFFFKLPYHSWVLTSLWVEVTHFGSKHRLKETNQIYVLHIHKQILMYTTYYIQCYLLNEAANSNYKLFREVIRCFWDYSMSSHMLHLFYT